MDRLPNIHPGEILRLEFMEPLRISGYRLAKDIRVPQTRVSQILRGERAISLDTAIRLGRYFDMTPQFWLNLQNHYDLGELQDADKNAYERIPSYKERSYDVDQEREGVRSRSSGSVASR